MEILVVNIGNSNIRFGIYNDNNWQYSFTIKTQSIGSSNYDIDKISSHYIIIQNKLKNLKRIFIASVVPKITQFIYKSLMKKFQIKPLIVGTFSNTKLTMWGGGR